MSAVVSTSSSRAAGSFPVLAAASVIATALCWRHPSKLWIGGAAVAIVAAWFFGQKAAAWQRWGLLLLLAVPGWKAWEVREAKWVAQADAASIRRLVDAEETLLALTPRLGEASKGLMDLRLPGPGAKPLFDEAVTVRDLGPAPALDPSDVSLAAHEWHVAAADEERKGSAVDLWRPLLDRVSYFDYAKCYLIDGDNPGGDIGRFDAKAGFEALARMKTGEWQSFHGKMRLQWRRLTEATPDTPAEWRIVRWETSEMHSLASPKKLFVESLTTALPSAEARERVQHCLHGDAVVKYYRDGMKTPPHPYFAPISSNHHPSVSVADIDNDGFDDIYITVRIGKNMLLHNNGNGTFAEDAAARGLDLPGHTTSIIFADFDNDGDVDALLGRSLLKVAYLENDGAGHFTQHKAPAWFPMATVSMSAADFNADGLLDVYVCTYRPAASFGASPGGGVAQVADDHAFDWPDEFFPPDLASEYKRRLKEERDRQAGPYPDILDQMGPPNVLLINRGAGKFEAAADEVGANLWRNSLQATWGDYDGDGDPDLYVANDWAMDNLLRNDGGKFNDVSREAGITAYGFAMGATWGDYDNDGREDVYVSNMYSKAGRRITGRLEGLRKTFAESAEGNWLYRQDGAGHFKVVSGLEPPALTVTKAGWSWGGKFADFDNDGWLDLYVMSGYFSAPKELSSELDL